MRRARLVAGLGLFTVWCAGALSGCREATRTLPVVPALPSCLGGAAVTEVNVTVLGDFPPSAAQVTAVTSTGMGGVGLGASTRVVEVDGLGASGLAAFGRTATLDLTRAPPPQLAVAYGPPDTLCPTAAMHYARTGHHATLLPSGEVLVSGGADRDGFGVTLLERYLPYGDGESGAATFVIVDGSGQSQLDPDATLGHAVSVLASGELLITGGAQAQGGAPTGIAYAGFTRRQPDGTLIDTAGVLPGGPRSHHAAVVLADGRVALLGGCAEWGGATAGNLVGANCASGRTLATTEFLDDNGGALGAGPVLAHQRFGHDAWLEPDGTVLLVGGWDDSGAPVPPEIWDPVKGSLRTDGSAQLSPGGVPLATGGWVGFAASPTAASMSLWLPDGTGQLPWATLPLRTGATVTTLDDGLVLVAGGNDVATQAADGALLLVDPFGDARGAPALSSSSWARQGGSATRLGDGSVLLCGGLASDGASATAAIYLHSRLGPYSNLPELVLDADTDPLVPRRFDRVTSQSGHLVVDHPDDDPSPEWVLVGGLIVGDFELSVATGRRGAAQAMILAGYRTASDLSYIRLAPGGSVSLVRVSAVNGQISTTTECTGVALPTGALPDGNVASTQVRSDGGKLTVQSAGQVLLSCRPATPLGRGRVGVGALAGTTWWSDLTVTRLGSP